MNALAPYLGSSCAGFRAISYYRHEYVTVILSTAFGIWHWHGRQATGTHRCMGEAVLLLAMAREML